jgi:hypothetical protein
MVVLEWKYRQRAGAIAACAVVGLGAWLWIISHRPPRAAGPLPQQAYVFQRDWIDTVRQAVLERGDAFSRLDILAAEISFHGDAIQTSTVAFDASAVRDSHRSIGLVLRIGPISSAAVDPFGADSAASKAIAAAARDAIAAAQRNQLPIDEFQIDFDCPDSRLTPFCNWVRMVQLAVAAQSPDHPIAVTITALPSWLNQTAFEPLARQAGSFVLQVHALHQPVGPDSLSPLCDTAEARRDIELASRVHVPFMVALPTYTYLAGFDAQGKLLGLLAESVDNPWPQATTWRTLRADPQALAALVQSLAADRPPELHGIIWYRLPVDSDQLNWRWPTLAAVMSGRAPAAHLTVTAQQVSTALWEFELTNLGDDDAPLTDEVSIAWQTDAGLVAADGLGGFTHVDDPRSHQVLLRPAGDTSSKLLPPGETRTVGWVRLSGSGSPTASLGPIARDVAAGSGH